MFARLKSFFTQEKGASPWIAVFAMTVLLAFTAMAVDLGTAYLQTSKLQAALDAGALAGANGLPNTATATSAAIDCVQRNGFTASDVVISFSNSNSKITVSSSKQVKTLFLGALGINEWTINRKAAAAKVGSGAGGVFDYRIFVGDTAYKYNMGGQFTINGSVHVNGSISISPGHGTVTGMVEAIKSLYINEWTTTVGGTVFPAQVIEMPDFTEAVDFIMPDTYDEYANASTYNSPWWFQTWTGSKYITGDVNISNGVEMNGDVYINGNLTVNGSGVKINGNLFVNGTINFNNTATVKGSIMAKNDINFRGGGVSVQASAPICIYSSDGNIDLTSAGTTATGIVYAPKGTVSLAGNTLTFYGSIVGKKVSGIPANLIMGESTQDFPFLPQTTSIKLVD